MTITLKAKKQDELKAARANLKKAVRAEHNAHLYDLASDAEKSITSTMRKKSLSDDDRKALDKAIDQLRYRALALVKGDDALRWMHDNGFTMKDTARNRYGKALRIVSEVLGIDAKFEQGEPMQRFINAWLKGDAIESDMTVTCREIAQVCNASPDKPFQGNTQPYAIIEALVNVGAATKQLAGRSASWHASSVTIKADSPLIKLMNQQNA